MRSNPPLRSWAIASLNHGVPVPIAPRYRHLARYVDYGWLWGFLIIRQWAKFALHNSSQKTADQHRLSSCPAKNTGCLAAVRAGRLDYRKLPLDIGALRSRMNPIFVKRSGGNGGIEPLNPRWTVQPCTALP